MVEYALQYASRGWPILPVTPGSKEPLTPHGVKDASTDPETIRAWWKMWPDANIGIACEKVVLLDVDGAAGEGSLYDLVPPAQIPTTPTCATPNDGRHMYFAKNGQEYKNSVGLRPGLDIRTTGAYVLAPPSKLKNGKEYVWEIDLDEADLAPIPGWLEEILVPVKGETIAILSHEKTAPGAPIPDGVRDSKLTQIAGSLRRYGAPIETILETLRLENRRCVPPKTEADLERIARSVGNYSPEPDTYHYTDSGNADRLVSMFGSEIRYCFDWASWLIWNGVRWEPDRSGRIRTMASDVVRAMYSTASEIEDKTDRAAFVKHAVGSESASRLRAMVDLAQPMVPVLMDDLDKDKMLLAVGNGTIDLRTGKLRDSRQDDLITKIANVAFDPAAQCPTWIDFVHTIFDGDTDTLWFVQKSLGYSLTGDTSEQCLFVCHGAGSNGKSTMLSTVQKLLGDYAIATPPSAVLASRNDSIPNDVARLRGVRFTTVQEIEQGRRLAEPMVKAMTGGDVIAARFLHAEFFDLVPEFKLWLATNHKPSVRGADDGIWRRIRMIPFTVRIPDDKQDHKLPEKLEAEASGILNWCLVGLRGWLEEGIPSSDSIREATEAYRTNEDILADFIDERITPAEGDLGAAELYDAYAKWCEKEGEKTQSQKWLANRLDERGFCRKRTKHGRMWIGVNVR